MAKKPRKDTKSEQEVIKDDLTDCFRGGLPVDLDKTIDKVSLRESLSQHLSELLDVELRNQETLIENLGEWQNQYRGIKEEKNFPFPKASNVSVPITRSSADQVFVRLYGSLETKKKSILVKAKKEEFEGLDKQIEDALDWFFRNQMRFKEKLLSPLLQCVKTGTGLFKLGWVEKRRSVYKYAETDKEKTGTTYSLLGTKDKAVLYEETEYIGPEMYPIDRADWVISSDATSIQDAYLCGFKRPYRLPEIELKTKVKDTFGNPIYSKDAVKRLASPDEYDDSKKSKAEAEGKELQKVDSTKPYNIWELWLSYDVNNDGTEDSIVVTYHRETSTILRCIYNPLFKKFRPFIDLVFYPVEYSFDGEGVCAILKQLQAAVDTIVNQRIDRMTQLNAPLIFVQSDSGLDNYTLCPGKTTPVDGQLDDVVKIVEFPHEYPDTFNQEDRLIALADRVIGIPPESMGITETDRPVFKEAAARLHEAQRKFQTGFYHVWGKITDAVYMILEMFAQYQPVFKYTQKDGTKFQEKTVNFPLAYIRDGLNIEVAASSELMNQDTRLERNFNLYTLLSDYMTKVTGMAQAIDSPQFSSEFKKVVLDAAAKGVKMVTDMVEDFDVPNPEGLVLDMSKVMNIQKVLAMSSDNQLFMQLMDMLQNAMQAPPEGGPPGVPTGG